MIKQLSLPVIFLVLFTVISLTSCDDNRVYDTSYTVPSMKWHMDSIYRFEIPITDTVNPHNVLLQIRNSGDYKYRNLYLYVKIEFPNRKSLTDTVNCMLADVTGKWLGSGWGSLWSSSVLYKRRIRFPMSGNYRISVQHAMRDTVLKAINNIGIRVEKSE
ncbi:MAG TPA: gliding motility lipoprotein GldH [Salinivirgaceae bacterium]|nr:gliding motility lipoprotein GldH [Salinivirgaceae bacterium]